MAHFVLINSWWIGKKSLFDFLRDYESFRSKERSFLGALRSTIDNLIKYGL